MRTYLLAFAGLLTTQIAFAQNDDFAITGARVVIGDGQTLDGATVVVKNGKIQSVSTASAPEGMTIVDGKGKFLYPGFIDAYSTRLTKSAPEPKTEGKPDTNTSAPPFMWIGNRKGIFSDFGASENLDFEKDTGSYENGITTVLIAPNKGCVRGSCAVVNLLPSTDKDRVLNNQFGFGLGFRNGAGDGYPSNILGVLALMRQVLSDAKSLADGVELTKEKAKPYWMKSLEDLKPLVTGTRPGIFEANLDREIERSLRFGSEFGFPIMIAGGRDAYKMIPQLTTNNVSVLYSVDNLIEPSIEPDKSTVAPADQTPVEFKIERHDKWVEQVKGINQIAKSGVPFAFSAGSTPGAFLENVRALIKNGLDKDSALKAMTINSANILGLKDQLGTIEMGKQANLVLMSGDFADKDSKVERVWVTGKAVLEPAKEVKK